MNKQEQLQYIADTCPLTTNHISNRRIRHNFFESIDTELQAYLLGFFASDGNINEKRKTLRIHLQLQDQELIFMYKDNISPDARTFKVEEHETTGRNGMKITAHESFGVDITSAQICNSLVNLGYGYDKSHADLHLPNIKPELIRHFIRGYFDGDGCITGWLATEKGKSDRFRYSFDICGKTSSILNEMMKFFANHDIKINMNYIKRDDMYRLKTSSKKEIEKLFHLLYDNSNFYLTRKFNKLDHYVNTEVTQLIAENRNAQEVNVSNSNNPSKSPEHPTNEDEDVR